MPNNNLIPDYFKQGGSTEEAQIAVAEPFVKEVTPDIVFDPFNAGPMGKDGVSTSKEFNPFNATPLNGKTNLLLDSKPDAFELQRKFSPAFNKVNFEMIRNMKAAKKLDIKDETIGKQIADKFGGFIVGNLALAEMAGELTQYFGRRFGSETLLNIGKDVELVAEDIKGRFLDNMGELSLLDEFMVAAGTSIPMLIPGAGVFAVASVFGAAPALATYLGIGVATLLESGIEGAAVMDRWLDKNPKDYDGAEAAGMLTFALNIPISALLDISLLRFVKIGGKSLIKEIVKRSAGKKLTKDIIKSLGRTIVSKKALVTIASGSAEEGIQSLIGFTFSDDPIVVKQVIKETAFGGVMAGGISSVIYTSNRAKYKAAYDSMIKGMEETAKAVEEVQIGIEERAIEMLKGKDVAEVRIRGLTKEEAADLTKELGGEAFAASDVTKVAVTKEGVSIPLTQKMAERMEGLIDTKKEKVLPGKKKELPTKVEPKVPTLTEATKIEIKGRIDKLESDMKLNDAKIDSLKKDILAKELEGKPSLQLQNKLHSLMDSNISKSKESYRLKTEQIELTSEKVEVRANQIQKLEQQKFNALLNGFRRGLKEGTRISRQEAKAVRGYLIDEVMKSELNDTQKKNLVASLKNIDTIEKFDKRLPQLQTKIEELAASNAHKSIRDSIKKSIRHIAKGIKKHDIRPEFQKKLEALISEVDLQKLSSKKREELKSTREFLNEHPDHVMPEEVLSRLDRLDKTPLSEMSIEDLETLDVTLKHLLKLNELKNVLIAKGKQRKREAVADRMIERLNLKRVEGKESNDTVNIAMRGIENTKYGKYTKLDILDMVTIAERLDDSKRDIFKEVFYDGLDEGVTKQLDMYYEIKDFFRNKIKGIDTLNWSESSFPVQSEKVKERKAPLVKVKLPNGTTLEMTKMHRVAFILHSRNDNSMRHILGGGISSERGASFSKDGGPLRMTQGDVDAVVESASKEETRVADAIAASLKKQWAFINDVHIELFGFPFSREENYFQIRTDPLDPGTGKQVEPRVLTPDSMRSFYKWGLEDGTFLIERVKATNALVLQDAITSFFGSLERASTFVGLAIPLRNAKMMINNPRVQRVMQDIYGKDYVDYIKQYIVDIEGYYVNIPPGAEIIMDTLNKTRSAILASNIAVVPLQPISYVYALVDTKFKYWQVGATSKPASKALMAKHSSQLRRRMEGHSTIEMDEIHRAGAVREFHTGKKTLSQKLMNPIREGDYQAIGRIWVAMEAEIKGKHPELKGDDFYKQVARRTEEIVNNTQPSSHAKDRSAIGRSKDMFLRVGTSFTSQTNKKWNMFVRALGEYSRTRDKRVLASAITVLYFAGTLLKNLVKGMAAIARGHLTREDFEKKFTEDLAKTILVGALDIITSPLQDIYFIGSLVTKLVQKAKGWHYRRGFTNLIYDIGNRSYDIVDGLVNGIEDVVENDEGVFNDYIKKATWNMAELSASVSKGLPLKNIKDIVMSPYHLYKFVTGDDGDFSEFDIKI